LSMRRASQFGHQVNVPKGEYGLLARQGARLRGWTALQTAGHTSDAEFQMAFKGPKNVKSGKKRKSEKPELRPTLWKMCQSYCRSRHERRHVHAVNGKSKVGPVEITRLKDYGIKMLPLVLSAAALIPPAP
jgi:hypothetical protein